MHAFAAPEHKTRKYNVEFTLILDKSACCLQGGIIVVVYLPHNWNCDSVI